MEPVDPKEIEYLQELLTRFENTGADTKRSEFIKKQRLSEKVWTLQLLQESYLVTFYPDTFGEQPSL